MEVAGWEVLRSRPRHQHLSDQSPSLLWSLSATTSVCFLYCLFEMYVLICMFTVECDRDRTMACHFFLPSHNVFKWRFECLNEVPVSPKSVCVLRVCLLLLLLAINAVNALWHPHTPVLSTDEREIWAVKIVRSSCQRCKTWIFRIKISSIVWVETYKGSFVVLIYSIDNKCISYDL